MVQRSPAEPSLSGFRLPSGAVLISIIAICLAGLATVAPAEDPFVILDPASEVYRRMAVGAGERVQIDKDTEVTGDVHSNDDVDLKKDTLVDGDVSATGEVKSKGTVTGEVTEGAAEIVLPALPSETELRALADRIFEGDVTLTDEVVDDVVFVGGKVRICGSLNGTGTLIAAGKITFEKADYGDSASGGPGVEAGDGDSKSGCGASTAVLESSTRMSLISLDTITFANNRRFRGVLRSALDVKLNKESVFEGVVLADDTVLVKKDSRITFATPASPRRPRPSSKAPASWRSKFAIRTRRPASTREAPASSWTAPTPGLARSTPTSSSAISSTSPREITVSRPWSQILPSIRAAPPSISSSGWSRSPRRSRSSLPRARSSSASRRSRSGPNTSTRSPGSTSAPCASCSTARTSRPSAGSTPGPWSATRSG